MFFPSSILFSYIISYNFIHAMPYVGLLERIILLICSPGKIQVPNSLNGGTLAVYDRRKKSNRLAALLLGGYVLRDLLEVQQQAPTASSLLLKLQIL